MRLHVKKLSYKENVRLPQHASRLWRSKSGLVR
jgi:hypothetical protein